MTNTDGRAHLPTRTMASQPAFFAPMAKCDDDRASFNRSVNGDLATTANLADVVNGVPTSGLKQKTSGASGASGSTPGGASRCRSHVPSPAPPRKWRKTDSGNGTRCEVSLPTSMRRYQP